jgi:hypothetical protein
MYARVARFEGASAEGLDEAAAEIRKEAGEGGAPEGVPAKEAILLTDSDGGRAMAIMLFETEEDYRQGDETLNTMTPPGDAMGRRISVEKYEVAVRAAD